MTRSASHAWLYVGSWAMGVGAFLIALTFRPVSQVAAGARPRLTASGSPGIRKTPVSRRVMRGRVR